MQAYAGLCRLKGGGGGLYHDRGERERERKREKETCVKDEMRLENSNRWARLQPRKAVNAETIGISEMRSENARKGIMHTEIVRKKWEKVGNCLKISF
jgi:hypothetical protein